MMHIRLSDIPAWLQDSEFFNNLYRDDLNDNLDIPPDCYRETCDDVSTPEDIANILNVVRFWGVKEIPESILEYCLTKDPFQWNLVYAEIAGEGTNLRKVIQSAHDRANQFTLDVALSAMRAELVSFWLKTNTPGSNNSVEAITHAAKFGRIDLIKSLHEQGYSIDGEAYCAAAQYGHAKALQYLTQLHVHVDEYAMLHAARGGQLECMQFLHSNGTPWKYLVTLEYAVPQRYALLPGALPKLSWSDDFTIPPPANGYIECLRYALENGCPIHDQACEHACKYNLLDCFQLLHKHGANVSFWCSIIAAIMCHIEILQYLNDSHGTEIPLRMLRKGEA